MLTNSLLSTFIRLFDADKGAARLMLGLSLSRHTHG